MRRQEPWRQTCGLRPRETEVSRYRHGCDPPRASAFPLDSHPPFQLVVRWRLLVLAWLIGWITAVPLYYVVHIPDTTDPWSALHSGGAHTVFTPDIAGEFSHPLKESPQTDSAHLSPRSVNSPELG